MSPSGSTRALNPMPRSSEYSCGNVTSASGVLDWTMYVSRLFVGMYGVRSKRCLLRVLQRHGATTREGKPHEGVDLRGCNPVIAMGGGKVFDVEPERESDDPLYNGGTIIIEHAIPNEPGRFRMYHF